MQWALLDEPPALLLKFTEPAFTSGGSAAGAKGGNKVEIRWSQVTVLIVFFTVFTA